VDSTLGRGLIYCLWRAGRNEKKQKNARQVETLKKLHEISSSDRGIAMKKWGISDSLFYWEAWRGWKKKID